MAAHIDCNPSFVGVVEREAHTHGCQPYRKLPPTDCKIKRIDLSVIFACDCTSSSISSLICGCTWCGFWRSSSSPHHWHWKRHWSKWPFSGSSLSIIQPNLWHPSSRTSPACYCLMIFISATIGSLNIQSSAAGRKRPPIELDRSPVIRLRLKKVSSGLRRWPVCHGSRWWVGQCRGDCGYSTVEAWWCSLQVNGNKKIELNIHSHFDWFCENILMGLGNFFMFKNLRDLFSKYWTMTRPCITQYLPHTLHIPLLEPPVAHEPAIPSLPPILELL